MILSLGGIALMSGLCLSLLYSVTKDPIDRAAARQQSEAISEVLPAHDNDPEKDMSRVKVEQAEFEVYPAMEGKRLAGAAVKGTTNRGFGGDITVICGFDATGNVVDYRVLQHAETPGLGSKMELWFRDPTAARSIIGRSPANESFTPVKDGGDVDAITAATISSRAFLWLISASYEAYRQYADTLGGGNLKETDASSGASHQTADASGSHKSGPDAEEDNRHCSNKVD